MAQLQKKALDKGVSESAVLDAGNSKNKLIDLIVHGHDDDGLTWTERATSKRFKDRNAAAKQSMFRQQSSINMDFHSFESDVPDADAHFVSGAVIAASLSTRDTDAQRVCLAFAR